MSMESEKKLLPGNKCNCTSGRQTLRDIALVVVVVLLIGQTCFIIWSWHAAKNQVLVLKFADGSHLAKGPITSQHHVKKRSVEDIAADTDTLDQYVNIGGGCSYNCQANCGGSGSSSSGFYWT